MSELQAQVRDVLTRRNSAEARALLEHLLRYVDQRVLAVWRYHCVDLVGSGERDEVVAAVMETLLIDGLARFRGETIRELLAYVRVVTDRALLHQARRRLRERRVLDGQRLEWGARCSGPEELVEQVPDVPLSEQDQDWLRRLLAAGSMAEHARREQVSRAAVTLRVQRIRGRIEALSRRDQDSVEAWLTEQAHVVASR